MWVRRDNGTNAVNLTSRATVFDDTWHHVAVVNDSGDVKLYVDGELDSTDSYSTGPSYFTAPDKAYIGAAANPYADPFEFRVARLAKKIKAGADFIQTQAVYDVPKFTKWMEMVCDRGLDKQVHILAGVIPVKSAGMARYMQNNVPGVSVPDEIIARLKGAESAKEEGLKIALETIEQLKKMPGVHGVHIMAVGWDEIVPEIVERVGLLPRPQL